MIQLPPNFDPNVFVSDVIAIVVFIFPVFVLLVTGGFLIRLLKRL